MRAGEKGCRPLTTQSLERRFKPLKPVLACAHPHEAIPALPPRLNRCPARVKTCLPSSLAHVRSLHLPAAPILEHIRYLTIDSAPTSAATPVQSRVQLGSKPHRPTSTTPATPGQYLFSRMFMARGSLPPAPSVPPRTGYFPISGVFRIWKMPVSWKIVQLPLDTPRAAMLDADFLPVGLPRLAPPQV